ncbi:hypothetical protein B0H63DRAFT_527263 [Podospora didyma]|uniref:Uncharacterized protein n=1 Tax=Podospora didyma TaxID=330526 RepID=A0AAE0KAB2_9PEZI|nr:hypothetical protein B0H63DRAFT_527263 [Podospora didyma]
MPEKEVGTSIVYLWACHECGAGSYNVSSTLACPNCYHYRCTHCAVERHRIPNHH